MPLDFEHIKSQVFEFIGKHPLREEIEADLVFIWNSGKNILVNEEIAYLKKVVSLFSSTEVPSEAEYEAFVSTLSDEQLVNEANAILGEMQKIAQTFDAKKKFVEDLKSSIGSVARKVLITALKSALAL